jgi:hypothetical protein
MPCVAQASERDSAMLCTVRVKAFKNYREYEQIILCSPEDYSPFTALIGALVITCTACAHAYTHGASHKFLSRAERVRKIFCCGRYHVLLWMEGQGHARWELEWARERWRKADGGEQCILRSRVPGC